MAARNTLSKAESAAQAEEMFTLRVSGWSLPDIANRFGCSVPNVSTRVAKYRASLPAEERADRRKDLDELYRKQLRRVEQIVDYGPIPAYSHGRAIAVRWDDQGNPCEWALDYSYVLKAIDTSLKIMEATRKMWGLDEPTKIEASGEVVLKLVGVDVNAEDGL